MMYIELFLLTCIIIFITDISGVISHIKRQISKILTRGNIDSDKWRFHLLDCSLCQTHWIGLLYIIITNNLSIPNYSYVCLLAYLTPVILNLLLLIKDTLNKIINKLC